VPARDQERDEGGAGARVLQLGGEEVRLHVVHPHHRLPQRPGRGLPPRHPHQESADEAGPGGDADQVDPLQPDPGLLQGAAHHVVHRAQVGARGQLRHHAAVEEVDVLGEDDVAEQLPLAAQDGGGGLVARGLDPEGQAVAHRRWSFGTKSALSRGSSARGIATVSSTMRPG
jgi:hypothetical protein